MTAHTEIHSVTLTKHAKRSLQEKVIRSNFDSVLPSVQTKSVSIRGWNLAWSGEWERTEDNDGEYDYSVTVLVSFTSEKGEIPKRHELLTIVKTLHNRASQPVFGSWSVARLDDSDYVPSTTDDGIGDVKDMIGYVDIEIPTDFESYFSHLYGLDAHIMRVKLALEAAIMSNWNNRYHVALVGPPGCGKSDICRSLKNALGEDAVMEFDATATTAAGAIKELTEREILPRVLVVEEIEKADEKALSFLLGLCDQRAEIRKTTARATIQRDTKLLVIATVNNVPLFEGLQAGALRSRFANMVWFKRPGRDMLSMILQREVKKINGDPAWITPALDYCESIGINDPRTVTAMCLCGREKLLDGSFQTMMAATASPMDESL